jgi:hypothetical protein
MSWRRLQLFFFAASLFVSGLHAQSTADQSYKIDMVDVDGNKLRTADGRITIIVAASSNDADKARAVGDRTPDFCLGNPQYQMITLLRFVQKHHGPMRGIISALIRRRLDAEAKTLQSRYDAKNISRDARRDIFSVTDFDGIISSQLGLPAHSVSFQLLLLGKDGQLLKQWNDVPAAEELSAALKQSQ